MGAAPRVLVALVVCAGEVNAQSFNDFTLVRNRPPEFSQVLEGRIGVTGSIPDDENEALGFESETGLDGHLYYHNSRFSQREAVLDAYAGRDGAYLALIENDPSGSASRIELTTRYAPFFREGFFRDGDFIPTGRFEGNDYGAYVGFGSAAGDGLHVEVGPYVRKFSFDRNDSTDSAYVLPDDYLAYGVRSYAEHNTLQLDRQTGRPIVGFILTIRLEGERNDSDRTFGTPLFMSRLPSSVWRGRGHLEWFLPQRDLGVWSIRIDGRYADSDDRVSNFDAQEPVGHIWVDGELGVRLDLGSLAITPYAAGQWAKAVRETGTGSEEELFFGGGARARWDLADALSMYAEYSFLENPSRAPVSATVDVLGEHQFFAGIELRIGAKRL